MELKKVIRTKFMPPRGDAYTWKDNLGYTLLDIGIIAKRFTPKLNFRSSFTNSLNDLYPRKNQTHDWFSVAKSHLNEDIKWFDTPEEARECAWDNFEHNYSRGVCHKEPG